MGLGIKVLILLVVLVAVAAAAHAVVSSYNSAIEEAVKNKNLAVKTAAERDGWIDVAAQQEAAKTRAEAALADREKARARLQQERDRARMELSKLREKPENVAWLDQPLPPDVVVWLRQPSRDQPPSAEGRRSGAASVAPGAVPSTVIRGQSERRLAPVR